MRKKLKITMALFLVLCMLLAMSYASLAQVSDIKGNWAEMQIRDWIGKKLVNGLPDGTFKPENPITRAEFCALINRAFGFFKKSDFKFTDVSKEWFANDISIGKAQGYLIGDGSNAMPNKPISRQEVITILARILKLKSDETAVSKYPDAASIASWAKGCVGAVSKLGYINEYKDNAFKPEQNATRAEVVAILYKAVGTLYNKAGTFEPDGGKSISGNVTVAKPDITLKNMTIDGNLYLTEGIGDGSVTLENVTVKGTTTISGGGEHSAVILNSTLGNVLINVPDNTKVRLVAKGSTSIGTTDIMSPAGLEEASLTGKGFGEALIEVPDGAKVELAGSFDKVDVKSLRAQLSVLSGIINEMLVNAKDSGFTMDPSVKINTLTVNQPTKMTGMCVIETAIVHSNDVKIEAKPKLLKKDAFLTGVEIGYGAASGGGGGGGGGGGPAATPTPTATPAPTEIPTQEIAITEVQHIENIQTERGNDVRQGHLPTSVQVTLNNDEIEILPVYWTCPSYNPDVDGQYTFSGTLTIPAGSEITNPDNLMASVTVTVSLNLRITGVDEIGSIIVDYGTALPSLPATASVTLNDGTNPSYPVKWEGTTPYDKDAAGEYKFIGTLDLPHDVTNPQNYVAQISVIVGEFKITVTSVDTFADKYVVEGTEIRNLLPEQVMTHLNDNTSRYMDVDWNTEAFNNNALGTYTLTGTVDTNGISIAPGLVASINVNVVHPTIDPDPNTPLRTSPGTVIDECDNMTDWTCTDNAIMTLDTGICASGSRASLNISATVNGSTDNESFQAIKVFSSSLNLSSMNNIEVNLYIPDVTQTDRVSIRFYSNSASPWYSNCYMKLISNWKLVNGWNRIRLPIDEFHVDGAVNWNSITCARIIVFPKEGCKPSVNVDRIAYNITGRTQVLFTFDDGWFDLSDPGISNNAYDILTAKGFDATVWAKKSSVEGYTGSNRADNKYLNETDLDFLYNQGWDIGNHTVTHPDNMSSLSDNQITQEFQECQRWLHGYWPRGAHFACYPSGEYDERIINILQGIGVLAARPVVYGMQTMPVDNIYKLKCIYVGDTADTDMAAAKKQIDNAVNTGSTIIFMLHKIEDTGDPLAMTTADFQDLVNYVAGKGDSLDVVTMSEWYEKYTGIKRITGVEELASINVLYGTQKEALGLPAQVNVTLNDGSTQRVAVTWDTSAYNGNVPGNHIFHGTLTPNTGTVNALGLTATITVNVAQQAITGVQNPTNITVSFGTGISTITLPARVTVNLTGGTTTTLPVTWDSSSYNGGIAGTYTLPGTFSLPLPDGVTNPDNIAASIDIIVSPELEIISVQTIPDKTVAFRTGIDALELPSTLTATLSSGSTRSLPVTWNTSAYRPDTAGTYTLTGTFTLPLPVGIKNTGNHGASVRVTVQEYAAIITSVEQATVAGVVYGTEASALPLPATVKATYNDGTTHDLDVTWDRSTYDPYTVGTCTLPGTLTLPSGITKPDDIIISIDVTVEPQEGSGGSGSGSLSYYNRLASKK